MHGLSGRCGYLASRGVGHVHSGASGPAPDQAVLAGQRPALVAGNCHIPGRALLLRGGLMPPARPPSNPDSVYGDPESPAPAAPTPADPPRLLHHDKSPLANSFMHSQISSLDFREGVAKTEKEFETREATERYACRDALYCGFADNRKPQRGRTPGPPKNLIPAVPTKLTSAEVQLWRSVVTRYVSYDFPE